MEKYKPGYLGKCIPADDPPKLTDFVVNKYDAFSKVYDACKDQSERINDIKVVDSGNNSPDTLSVKISTNDDSVVDNIKEAVKDDDSVTVKDDVITAKS